MGTRADFYIQRGELKDAIYLGSVAWDGFPGGIDVGVIEAPDEENFTSAVRGFFSKRESSSTPDEHGWPWPWPNSNTTDFSYVFCTELGRTDIYCFGGKRIRDDDGEWLEIADLEFDDGNSDFPDMTDIQNVTRGPRSGLMILGLR